MYVHKTLIKTLLISTSLHMGLFLSSFPDLERKTEMPEGKWIEVDIIERALQDPVENDTKEEVKKAERVIKKKYVAERPPKKIINHSVPKPTQKICKKTENISLKEERNDPGVKELLDYEEGEKREIITSRDGEIREEVIERSNPGYLETSLPVYPRFAREEGYEGTVHIAALVNEHGKVNTIEIAKSSGYRILDDSALRAVKKWRFSPAFIKESTVSSYIQIPITFTLEKLPGLDLQTKPTVYSTWEGKGLDKLASAWLIKKFIDGEAVVKFYPQGTQLMEGTPFDVPFAEWHRGDEYSTFERILEVFQISDPRLVFMGEIIHKLEVGSWHQKKTDLVVQFKKDFQKYSQKEAPLDNYKQSFPFFDHFYKQLDHLNYLTQK